MQKQAPIQTALDYGHGIYKKEIADGLLNNNRFSAKLSWKRKQNIELSQQIEEYFADKNIKIPSHRYQFTGNEDTYLGVDEDTGEYLTDEYKELAKTYYSLKGFNKAIYAKFTKGGYVKTQVVGSFYSKHRLDQVWNWRKSQIIRKIYKDFIQTNKLHENYNAMHLTLTVPHDDKGYKGKRFYGKELLRAFNTLRKEKKWKEYIYAGEYGMEVTRNSKGFHIHLHCLILQRKKYKRNDVEKYISKRWKALTQGTFVHYETLYTYRKDENGKYIMQLKKSHTELPMEDKLVRKKFYLEDTAEWYQALTPEEKLENYVNGVMECIKYHFKQDSLKLDPKNEKSEWDVELIKDVLNNSKGLRFYSKFGAFYREQALNFSRLEQSADKEETTEKLAVSVKESFERLLNPFTKKKANPEEFEIVIGVPERIKHLSKNSDKPYEPLITGDTVFYQTLKDKSLGQIIRALALGRSHEILEWKDFHLLRHDEEGMHRAAKLPDKKVKSNQTELCY